jgi:hypothetical protein
MDCMDGGSVHRKPATQDKAQETDSEKKFPGINEKETALRVRKYAI